MSRESTMHTNPPEKREFFSKQIQKRTVLDAKLTEIFDAELSLLNPNITRVLHINDVITRNSLKMDHLAGKVQSFSSKSSEDYPMQGIPIPRDSEPTEAMSSKRNMTGREAAVLAVLLRDNFVMDELTQIGIQTLDSSLAEEIIEHSIIKTAERQEIPSADELNNLRKETIRLIRDICVNDQIDHALGMSEDGVRLLLTYFVNLGEHQNQVLELLLKKLKTEVKLVVTTDRNHRVIGIEKIRLEKSGLGPPTKTTTSENVVPVSHSANIDPDSSPVENPGVHAEDLPRSAVEELEAQRLASQVAPAERSKTRREQFAEDYRHLVAADPDASLHINQIVGDILNQMPEILSDPDSQLSPARITQIYNNVSASFIDKAEDVNFFKAPQRKGFRVYGLVEVAILKYLKEHNPQLNMNKRTKKELHTAVDEIAIIAKRRLTENKTIR